MGTDIHGFVEQRNYRKVWEPIINIQPFIARGYDMFGMLFGVRSYLGFEPLARSRGLPVDVSDYVRHQAKSEDYWGHTWLGYGEIKAIDWDESCIDGRIHRYHRESDGTLTMDSKAGLDTALMRIAPGVYARELHVGEEWQNETHVWRVESLKRRDILKDAPRWQHLLTLMDDIMGPSERIRLVVWFDD